MFDNRDNSSRIDKIKNFLFTICIVVIERRIQKDHWSTLFMIKDYFLYFFFRLFIAFCLQKFIVLIPNLLELLFFVIFFLFKCKSHQCLYLFDSKLHFPYNLVVNAHLLTNPNSNVAMMMTNDPVILVMVSGNYLTYALNAVVLYLRNVDLEVLDIDRNFVVNGAMIVLSLCVVTYFHSFDLFK